MLNLVVVDTSGRRSVSVASGPFTIGRSGDSKLQLSDAHVSRLHAELIQHGSTWRIRDLGSSGGTFLNDTRIEDAAIKAGDRIRIGSTELRVETGESSALTSGHFDFRQVNALLAGLRALGSGQVLDEVLAIVLDSTLELTGEHLHLAVADPHGAMLGGHMMPGCTVRTTLELVIGELTSLAFSRQPCAVSGYDELVISSR